MPFKRHVPNTTTKETDMNHTERPCAAAGLTSYRSGHIMIGATSTQDALNEAGRSLTQGAVTRSEEHTSELQSP